MMMMMMMMMMKFQIHFMIVHCDIGALRIFQLYNRFLITCFPLAPVAGIRV